jgi:hypothetical protein
MVRVFEKDVRTLFTTPVLCEFAAAVGEEAQQAPIEVPSNLILSPKKQNTDSEKVEMIL